MNREMSSQLKKKITYKAKQGSVVGLIFGCIRPCFLLKIKLMKQQFFTVRVPMKVALCRSIRRPFVWKHTWKHNKKIIRANYSRGCLFHSFRHHFFLSPLYPDSMGKHVRLQNTCKRPPVNQNIVTKPSCRLSPWPIGLNLNNRYPDYQKLWHMQKAAKAGRFHYPTMPSYTHGVPV